MAGAGVDGKAQREIGGLFEALIEEGKERGLQATAYLGGRKVLDVWAGEADHRVGRKVDGETLFPIYSSGKGITATVVHRLAEKGKLSYDEPVARYWPAFGGNGKGGITVRHAMSHTSGLADMPMDVSFEKFHDWEAMCRWLEGAKAATAPGSEMAYHAVTYGWILGELARRVDGRSFAEQVRAEICGPLGMEGMYFGIPDAVEGRVAEIEAPPPEPPTGEPPAVGSVPDCIMPLGEWMNKPAARRSCIPGSSGIMTTRAMARHYAALVPGGVDGVELLPASRIREATQMQRATNHPEKETRQGLGYVLGNVGEIFGHRAGAFGHQGYGGSMGFADPSAGFAMAFARNRFFTAETPGVVVKAITEALGLK